MPEDGKTLARLQKQVLENNKARLKKLPTEIANSTSLNDATERLKGLVDQNEIYDKNIFSQCVNNYINLLDRNLGNIDSKEYLQLLRVLKHIKNNNEYDLLEIKEVFANHSKNYAQSVNFQFENRIDDFIIKIYDILLSSTSSTEDLHYSFMSRDILLSKSIYTILKKGLPKDFPLDNSVLMMASQEKFSYQETKYLIEKFRIDITNISKTPHIVTLGNKEVTLLGDITPILLEHANKIWIKNPPEGEKLLSLFIEKGMNLSAKQSYNNAVMIAIERDNLGMLLQLLKSGANANIAIRPETDETCNFIKTPFMTATGRKNFGAMKILLDFGADPYLPEKEYRKAYGSNDDVEILATTRNTNDISPFTGDGAEEYTIKCHSFIQNYFLEKITLQLSQIAHESKSYGQEIVTTSTNEIKEEASPVIEEIPSNVDISANVDETLNKYSDYLQEAASDTRLPDFQQIQCQFDSLLLDFVQTSREDTLTKLWELLDRNPDLHGYSITTLINKKTGVEIAKDVLATTPKTLDEFFRQKKQQIEGREKVDTNSEEKTLGPNMYKILSKYGESFFKIANNCWEFAKKYSAKFEKMHFISPNSEGEIGIKHYNDGLVKMKLATNCDDALCCTKIFVNNDTNQKLYLFDEIKNHNEVSKAGVVTYTGMDGDVFDDMVYGK